MRNKRREVTDPILADMQEYHRLPGIFSVKSVMMTIIATSLVGSLQNAVKNCFVTNLSSVTLDPDETYLCSPLFGGGIGGAISFVAVQ